MTPNEAVGKPQVSNRLNSGYILHVERASVANLLVLELAHFYSKARYVSWLHPLNSRLIS
jgi:hypothetical protein